MFSEREHLLSEQVGFKLTKLNLFSSSSSIFYLNKWDLNTINWSANSRLSITLLSEQVGFKLDTGSEGTC